MKLEEHNSESQYQLVCGIQRYLRSNGRHFLSGSAFQPLKDAKIMKCLRQAGVGVDKKQSEPINSSEEELL